ncbi:hypothetical protein B5C34_03210 [Pacificimonas flava]|uniref:Cell division protein FtsX n=2 Tax=Pacificimonas TaxID=1960290 RepID=A0A219B346_9SPHN|nr:MULTISPECIES: permease [Pacificimonas]MBZ6377772.1 permease [Pacificimonas aurantium]OWV32553.1 hypothetical protein B5C34_03210 [Pacificimonas flava]
MARWAPRAERYRYLPAEPVLRTSLPWLVALTVLLATLGMAVGLSLVGGLTALGNQMSGGFTIQVADGNPDRRDERSQRLLSWLADREGVVSAARVPGDEMQRLLEPWLGDTDLAGVLVMPAMIDVELAPGVEARRLAAELRSADPDITVDSHADWFAPVGQLGTVLAVLAMGFAVLLLAAMAAIVVLGVRAGLGRHREALGILHVLGAEERTIAGLFQYRFALTALAGAAGGFVLAVLLILLIAELVGGLGSGLLLSAGLSPLAWLLLGTVPVVAVFLAMMTSRLTVQRALAEQR